MILVLLLAVAIQLPRDSAAADSSAARRMAPVLVTSARSTVTTAAAGAIVVHPDSLRIPPGPAAALDGVLRQTPFVLVRQNSRGEAELSVRGSDSRQAAVLLDGLPLTHGWDHRSDASLIPAAGIQRITLVRGLASLLDGPNTLGGVLQVEMNTRPAPRATGTPPTSLHGGTGIDQYGARAADVRASASARAGRTIVTLRGGAGHRMRHGIALSRGGGADADAAGGTAADPGSARHAALRTNSDLRQADVFATARVDAPSGAYAGVTATGYDAARGVAPELHVSDPRLWRYPRVRRRLAIVATGTGPVRTPFGTGRIDASAGANGGTTVIESFTDRSYATVDSRELGDERVTTGRATMTHTLSANGTLRLGGTVSDVGYDETLDAGSPGAPASRYRQRLASFGGEAEYRVGTGIVVSAGVVRDAARTPETGGRPALGALARAGWRAGVQRTLDNGVSLHASASRRARFPALRELYSGALNRFDPNPGLRPERLLGLEAGATLAPGTSASAPSFQAVAFHHRLEDAIARITLPGRLFRRVNRDEVRSTGVELMGTWSPRGGPALSLGGNLTVQHVRVFDVASDTATGSRHADHQPAVHGLVEVGGTLPMGVQLGAIARVTGRQRCAHPDLGREVSVAARGALDVGASRAWTRRNRDVRWLRSLRAIVALDNATDATVYDQCGLPRPGRSVRLAFEIS